MLDLSAKKKSDSGRKQAVRTGIHTAEVTSVSWAPGYKEGDAIVVKYNLIYDDGTKVPYEELFYNKDNNARTRKFFKHLEDNDILDISDYVGCTEEVVIVKTTDGFRTYKTIDERNFISGPSSDGGAE